MQPNIESYQQRAEDCLRALILGIHPKTQEELAHPGVLAEPDVLRSLMLALKALESRRMPRQNVPGENRYGEPWTESEERLLVSGFKKKKPIRQLAEEHGRSRGGIASRLTHLGLMHRERHKPRE